MLDFTVGEVLASLRDVIVILAAVRLIWAARGWYQQGIDFKNRCVQHMDMMEANMTTLLDNHLKHMRIDIKTIAGRKADEVEGG
jgi:hypothetical protein